MAHVASAQKVVVRRARHTRLVAIGPPWPEWIRSPDGVPTPHNKRVVDMAFASGELDSETRLTYYDEDAWFR